MHLFVAATAGLAWPCAAPLAAQDAGTLVGTVVDARTLEPVGGATAVLVGHDRSAVAGPEGRFSFGGLLSGEVTIRVSHPGYGTVVERYPVTSLEATLIQFYLLPLDIALDELLVEVRRARDTIPGSSEALVPGDGLSSMTAADLLAQRVPGLVVDRTSGAVGGGARVLIRGLSSMSGDNAPAIYLDGVRLTDRSTPLRGSREPQAFHALELIPASDVKQIRVLRGPAASARYPDASNGVIVIETRTGGRDGAPGNEDRGEDPGRN